MWLDARIPLRLQTTALEAVPEPDAVLLTIGDVRTWCGAAGWAAVRHLDADAARSDGAHGTDCACCRGRSKLATGLSELFRQGVGGEFGRFRQVVLVVPADDLPTALRLLAADPVVTARYRIAATLGENPSPPGYCVLGSRDRSR